jgi:hypothetical protein
MKLREKERKRTKKEGDKEWARVGSRPILYINSRSPSVRLFVTTGRREK